MNHPSRYLAFLFLGLMLLAVAFTFWRTMVVRDFIIVNDIEEVEEGEEIL